MKSNIIDVLEEKFEKYFYNSQARESLPKQGMKPRCHIEKDRFVYAKNKIVHQRALVTS